MILISTHAEQDYAELIAASPAVGFLPKTALSADAIRQSLAGRGDGAAATHNRIMTTMPRVVLAVLTFLDAY